MGNVKRILFERSDNSHSEVNFTAEVKHLNVF